MNEFWNLVFSGLVTGAIYSIMASGLVLTYTTSGIFNFAHGAVAFATAYLYYQLNTGLGVPIVPALVIAVFIFAPLLGLLLDRILLRRLAQRRRCTPGSSAPSACSSRSPRWSSGWSSTVGNDVLDLGFKGDEAINEGASRARGSARRRTTRTRSVASSSTPTRSRCSSSPRSPRSCCGS